MMSLALPLTAAAAQRIVSIGGDVTEIAFALGAGDEVIARDSTSLHPEAVKKLPDVGYMRQLNAEGILALKPTLVLTTELAQPALVLKQLADSGVNVVSVPGDTTLQAVPQKIATIAAALQRVEQGKQLSERYRQQLAAVDTSPLPVKVLFVMSHGGITPMAAGQHTAADAVIAAAGLKNAMQGFDRYRPLSQEGVIASAPDLLLVTTDGVRTLGGEQQLWTLPGLALTPAGKQRRVLIVDDMALLGFGLETPAALAKLRHAAEQNDAAWHIWLNIRLPRVLLAVVIGCALAVSGAVMQGLFRNPLADPSLLGISSGGALFVALFIVMPLALPVTIALYGHMLAAFLGSLLVSLLIYGISRSGHGNLSQLLLAGIAINALCMAAIGVLSYVSSDQQLRQFSLWMMGSLSQSQWPTLAVSASLILPTALLTLLQARRLNLLQLGDEEAHYLGVNVQRAKLQLLLLSALLIGAAVAMSGVIGFVGLVVPHLVRMRLGGDHRWLLPCSALGGACLLLVSDTLARTLVAPAEMPVGLMTSLIGGPYFLWLVMRQRERTGG
ncbi:hypothetical protein KR044_009991 [Drosophila immigrans]|nr:hypothetical protein KR044_009991 [Drosophila immigrans]